MQHPPECLPHLSIVLVIALGSFMAGPDATSSIIALPAIANILCLVHRHGCLW
jgi:hypothetical protein